MSKTIKTINLLNKRANGEKLPQKIKYLDEYYTLYEEAESIENLYLLDGFRVGWFNHANFRLNTVIEVIEEQEEIDKLEIDENGFIHTNNGTWKGRKLDVAFAEVINKLAEEVKNIKEK